MSAAELILYACFSRLLRSDAERAPGIREVVRILLAAGADPNASFIEHGEWLQVALYGAAGIAGDPEVTRMLLEAGADPTDEREGYHGNEVLYHACELRDPTCAMRSIEGGQFDAMIRQLDGGARVDGDPDSDEIPLGHACWRRRVEMTRELVQRGAAPAFRDGGSAIGAALHGSRHCQHPEGGPSMAPVDEIPQEPYAAIVRLLLEAGAAMPDRIGEDGTSARALLVELGIDPPT